MLHMRFTMWNLLLFIMLAVLNMGFFYMAWLFRNAGPKIISFIFLGFFIMLLTIFYLKNLSYLYTNDDDNNNEEEDTPETSFVPHWFILVAIAIIIISSLIIILL